MLKNVKISQDLNYQDEKTQTLRAAHRVSGGKMFLLGQRSSRNTVSVLAQSVHVYSDLSLMTLYSSENSETLTVLYVYSV
jgi:hypothetical protein